jgi:Kef-type K+ transport system membrane component KefB
MELARMFGIGLVASLTVGLTISITAVPVNSIILMELGILDTEVGTAVIAAGVIDDIISFAALGMIQQFGGSGRLTVAHDTDVLVALAKLGIFFAGLFISERLIRTNLPAVRKKTERFASGIRAPGSYIIMLLVFAVGSPCWPSGQASSSCSGPSSPACCSARWSAGTGWKRRARSSGGRPSVSSGPLRSPS